MRNETRSVLVVSVDRVFPTTSGVAVGTSNWIRLIRQTGARVTLLGFDYAGDAWSEAGKTEAKQHVDELVILPVKIPPVLRALHRAILPIWSFLSPELFRETPLLRLGLRKLHRQISHSLQGRAFSHVACCKLVSAEFLGWHNLRAMRAIKIIDIHDIHSLHFQAINCAVARLSWREVFRWGTSFAIRLKLMAFQRHYFQSLFNQEIHLLKAFDWIVAWSPSEAESLQRVHDLRSRVINSHYPIDLPPPITPGSPVYDFGMIGADSILNIEGLRHFLSHVWPLIREKRPGATLFIAGRMARISKRLLPDMESSGVHLIAHVESLSDFYRNIKVALVPLLQGSGVSVKMFEAMSYGVPVVATQTGARGLVGDFQHGCVIADDPQDFAEACIKLLDSPELRQRLGSAGRARIAECHSLERQGPFFSALLSRPPQ